ncbi:MAG: 50S ribosomal protein L13 [Candidatus Diapherotrites archaeon]
MTTPNQTTKKTITVKMQRTHTIDATNLIVGRMASLVAEKLLKGDTIIIINTEKAVFTGNDRLLVKRWQTRLDLRPRGNPEYGPIFHKTPDRIVREIVEGMVPSKQERGRDAMRRLKTYIGIPSNVKKEGIEIFEKARNTKTKNITSVLELARALGYHQPVKG